MNLNKLKGPFPAKDIEWRIQRSGIKNDKPWAMVLAYVTARAIMDRLDEVIGPENWEDKYEHLPNGVMCTLRLRITPSEKTQEGSDSQPVYDPYQWVEKQDGAPETDIESFKGGISNALKRAAVKWGIGRYLYNLEENFAKCQKDKPGDATGWHYAKTRDGSFWWKTPSLPAWALPSAKEPREEEKQAGEEPLEKGIENNSQNEKEQLLQYIKERLRAYTNKFKDKERLKELYKQFDVKNWDEMTLLSHGELSTIAMDL